MLLTHWARRAASRAACTAGSKRAIRTAMMAITTNSSISVNPRLRMVSVHSLEGDLRRVLAQVVEDRVVLHVALAADVVDRRRADHRAEGRQIVVDVDPIREDPGRVVGRAEVARDRDQVDGPVARVAATPREVDVVVDR